MELDRRTSLPVELLCAICEEVRANDVNESLVDLLNIRLASRDFCAIVTPFVFRAIYVRDDSSTRKLRSILMSPHLVKEIKNINIIVDKDFSESQ
jgi:hypothetical protein